ncbi:MAG: PA0069 family radical SAM protein [Gammaproteobacteria bacterium]|nr:PA0069 family radical SAM protein [Gammaproteobacteria bacterium]
MNPAKKIHKGRGTSSKVDARFLEHRRAEFDDGWALEQEERAVPTEIFRETPRTVITRNQSPDIPFETSVNPYRGCEHGCVYCYARPSHAYVDLSPGIDFETKIFAKTNAAEILRKELGKPRYVCKPIAMGTNTDPYQPAERQLRITRDIIQVLHDCRHPLSIVTKSWLVERDLDLLGPMAADGLAKVFVSVTSLDHDLARRLEPRTTAPARRLKTVQALNRAGVPTGVMFAPVIPFINDAEMETVLEQAAAAGAKAAGYVILRLPNEVKRLFREWLETHEPGKTEHVFSIIRDLRSGRENDPEYFTRMRGQGVYADLVRSRFQNACRKLGLNNERGELDTGLFKPPVVADRQQSLF